MARYIIKRNENGGGNLEAGCWRDQGAGVKIRCPECKKIYYLDHEVDAEGNVDPSVDCPTESCSFHEMVKLDDFPPFGGGV